MIGGRTLSRDEIEDVWTIDRSELIEAVFQLANGALVLRPARFDVRGWPLGEADRYTPILQACHDRGGWLYGLFEGQRLIGAAVLESRFIGGSRDQLQLAFLHVSAAHRHQGWGQHLFALAAGEARRRGARGLYISATPSQRTVDFYLRLGCRLSREPDAELLALEPEDIHLEYAMPSPAP